MAAERTTWKLTLTYDGGPFAGWQVQPGLRTVQGELAAALERITSERTLPQGSGRTDAGVHALEQVASVELGCPIPPANLLRALNHALPAAIRVIAAEHAPPGFHARHSAVRKTYEYRVYRGAVCPPWIAPYVWPCTFRFDVEAMGRAAALLEGTHDFRSFQAHDPDAAARAGAGERSTVRTVFSSRWEAPEPDLLVYRVSGSGFLHHMVRTLVGTLVLVGRGLLDAEGIPAVLAARARAAGGPTAPASGLWLHSVQYPG